MVSFNKSFVILSAAVLIATGASAEVLDRPAGFKIGQRMVLRPYVSFSATYDSNVNGSHGQNTVDRTDDIMWTVNPGLSLDYRAEKWSLLLTAYYNYHAYTKKSNSNNNNQHTYGQTLRWNWANSGGREKGWTLMLSETFQQISMADDLMLSDGRAYSADRRQFSFAAGAQRRFNEHWHSELNANYYWLNYQNDTSMQGISSLYGWQRWQANLMAGYAPSQWTDIILAGAYNGYKQDNTSYTGYSNDSMGFSAQAGLGSFATERISYRMLAGWSRFEYASGAMKSDGFVYTISGSWKISETWNTMLLATSYYQPSERAEASQSRVDSASWGLGKSLIRGKLRATLDLTYRRETHDSALYNSNGDYVLNVATGRLGFNYTFNRFLGGFIYGEYQRSWNSESDRDSGLHDYDRWRVTGGIRLTY